MFTALITLIYSAESVRAADSSQSIPIRASAYQYEAWTGADATSGQWSVYGGMTASLFGDIRTDGFRLRTAGGYGHYSYSRPAYDPFVRKLIWPKFSGTMTFVDALLGYQWSVGPAVIKAYAGVTEETHSVLTQIYGIEAYDDENRVQGSRRGFKGALETWISLNDWGFIQTDMNWSQPFKSYSGRLRAGYRLNPAWSAGLEAAAFGNLNHDHGRAGGFLRFEWTGGEISVSTGFDGDAKGVDGAYASVSALLRF